MKNSPIAYMTKDRRHLLFSDHVHNPSRYIPLFKKREDPLGIYCSRGPLICLAMLFTILGYAIGVNL